MPATSKTIDILLVENNPADARLMIEALKEIGLNPNVTCLADGDEALAYLRHEGPFQGTLLPDLILLDLNLTRVSGLEVLEEVKTNQELECIQVVVVSGSSNPANIREAYRLKASCFISKQTDLNEFVEFVRRCFGFWGTAVTFPPKSITL